MIYIYTLWIHPEKSPEKSQHPQPSPGQPGGIPTGGWDLGPNELREDELAGEAWVMKSLGSDLLGAHAILYGMYMYLYIWNKCNMSYIYMYD